METYNNLTIDLSGRNLIEASAGTGKTYAIACLYLRLVVERGLKPEEILVVTFTEAATKELRSRIRERLREARDVFAGAGTTDDFLLKMGDTNRKEWPGTEEALRRLDLALRTFDCAAISTIHGFCSRALQENAFESGSLYDTELLADQNPLIQEIVDDFWRQSFFGAEAPLLPHALRLKWSPEGLARFLRGKLGNPELLVVPLYGDDEVAALVSECEALYGELTRMWESRRGEIEEIIATHKGLRRAQKNYHPDLVPGLLEGMADYTASGNPWDLCPGFEKFTTAYIQGQALQKNEPPEHPFFDLCDRLFRIVEKRFLALKGSLFTFARERLSLLKAERAVRSYDDLLTDLYRALQGPTGADLADRLASRYRAALIDEFQDTDPVQYRIFREIYLDAATPLFLIGDPKQAIYSFRGADIFAYLEARNDVPAENRFTMGENWRSTPSMVEGINALFRQKRETPFVVEAIGYPEVTAAKREEPLLLDGRDPAPLQLWFMARTPEDGAGISMGPARERIVMAVGAEIAGLLADGREGRATIDGRGVVPEDIAVIVRSHKEAALVQEGLRGLGIPSVVQSAMSLFATEEAREICRILEAVAEPSSETRVRAALATTILGMSGNDIARLLEDERGWEERLEAFREYHDFWQGRGFMTMFRTLLAREGVRERLLPFVDGERRLTNVLHCGEVIHGAAMEGSLGVAPLCAWFGERVNSPPPDEEYQIRLESDEKAVRIVTVHVSKGLEYPIVFCPFTWGGVRDDDDTAVCHDGYRMVADFGSDDYKSRRLKARNEALAENVRLLYVALTRARHRCYLVWGKFRYAETSALAYLLHHPADSRECDIKAVLGEVMKGISDEALLKRLDGLKEEGGGAIAVTVDPAPEAASFRSGPEGAATPVCPPFGRKIESDWRVASFTSFAARHRPEEELPDRDQPATVVADSETAVFEVLPAEGTIFAFPKGSQAGIVLHAVFENLDFAAATDAKVVSVVAQELARHGFGEEWRGAVCAMVRNVLDAPLDKGDSAFRLADLAPHSWRAEMEFFFPLRFVGSEQVAAVLRRWGALPDGATLAEVAARLDFSPVQGMVRGFMDMVFEHRGKYYLIDWKSNHLGNRVDDYGRENLGREMERKLYPLQYLLYTVALNLHLKQRVPGYRYETHFGGALYVFLRGVEPGRPGCGIYHDIPPKGLIDELTSCLVALKEHNDGA
ncbi:exodeoxyribonuclease V, beta subunit [Geobacter metallireducens RCH3]|uniref:DNA 3'-5' helicase n=1 Tax=Geobacter metallireducens (strain ATCC 53774 / DSM 7210 / GS-15) TaxID=269799 RepID=Q39UF2_GEOMG|nr:exodeoxyribonuclease V subunit beta [Geobacter metallireducens]ABB32122.1 exodeoxyribonuclease V, beta subunit [Geobacter metallireducens GS-15]EHP88689.1 exodeoxyribonuclease V, beta subunit [Geobacter metallireducens RCH3]